MTESDIRDLHKIIQKAAYDIDLKVRLDILEKKLASKLYNNIRMRDPRHATKRINDLEQEIQSDIVFIGPKIKTDISPLTHEILNKAISQQKIINICYIGQNLSVCPLCIVQDSDNIYLVASKNIENTSKMEPDITFYKISEIEKIMLTDKWFNKSNSFSAQRFSDLFFGISADTKKYDIELLVYPDAVLEAKRYIFHKSQENIYNPDGSMTIKFKAAGLHPLCLYLMQWDGLIKPLAPKKLVQEFRNILIKYLDNLKQN